MNITFPRGHRKSSWVSNNKTLKSIVQRSFVDLQAVSEEIYKKRIPHQYFPGNLENLEEKVIIWPTH